MTVFNTTEWLHWLTDTSLWDRFKTKNQLNYFTVIKTDTWIAFWVKI